MNGLHQVRQLFLAHIIEVYTPKMIKLIFFFFWTSTRGGALNGLRKIKNLTIISLYCEILNNFATVLFFGTSKSLQSDVVAHKKKLKIIHPFCDILNNFSTVLVFCGFKSDICDFCHVYTWFVS